MGKNNQSNSNRGGARKGAGRKPGAATTKTREIADRAMAEGITPLEVMLRSMRLSWAEADRLAQEKGAAGRDLAWAFRAKACEYAKDAAPYIHPRLQAVEHSTPDGRPLKVSLVWEVIDGSPHQDPAGVR